MTQKEALTLVLEAATKYWGQDTRDINLKEALRLVETRAADLKRLHGVTDEDERAPLHPMTRYTFGRS